ncbi:MAG TPA: hypothetical protein VK103_00935, partial [Bacillota bacterium]|nr:hypothetical protein [Bacillota bacterium]
MGFLRTEAWRLSVFERGKHLWRRRHEEDSDLALITALQKLSPSSRRLIVLQTIGEVDPETAAREVQMTVPAAAEAVSGAVETLQSTMATGLGDIEERLRDLANISDRISLPRPHGLRREARRRNRRRTLGAVVTAAVAVALAGIVATENPPMSQTDASPTRQQFGDEQAPATPKVVEIDNEQMLDVKTVGALGKPKSAHPTEWEASEVASGDASSEPFTICAPRRFSDRKAR